VDDLATFGFTDQWIGLALSTDGILHVTYRTGTQGLRHAWAALPTTNAGDALAGGVPALVLALGPGSPNPAAGSVALPFVLPVSGAVRLAVHDASGRLVRVLAHGELAAGQHQLSWDGRDGRGRAAAGGVYFLRLDSAAGSRRAKIVLAP
jgi:hypothetical protein